MVPHNNTVYQSGPLRNTGGCRKQNVMGLGFVGETGAESKHGPAQPHALCYHLLLRKHKVCVCESVRERKRRKYIERERARGSEREAITQVPSTLTSSSFRDSQSLIPRSLAGKSISSWFYQHYKQDSKGATDCVSLLFSLFLSFPASPPTPPRSLLLTLTSLVP